MSFVRCTSFAPSSRRVVRSSTRVPTAYKERKLSSNAKHGCWLVRTYSKAKVESDEKNRELEVESVVEIVVVDDDRRGQDNPYGNDHRGRKLWFWGGRRDGGGQWANGVALGLLFWLGIEELGLFDQIDWTTGVLEELFCSHPGRVWWGRTRE